MNWKEWYLWKGKKTIGVLLFIVAYILTIPIRDYSFLEGLVDITQGVPMGAHLAIIVVGSIVFIILLSIFEFIVKKVVLRSR